jgi:ABC-type branched-subunit amino acid transport system substrate-binding protein
MTNPMSLRTRPDRGWRLAVALFVVAALLSAVGCAGRRGADPDAGATQVQGADQGQSEGASFGDLASPCGPGDASGTTQQGVTDESITIGYGDDAGYQGAPGLNHEMSDAVEAMIAWCNDQGGIEGRQVVGRYYDAKVLEASNAVQEACSQVFMLVGEGFALDGGAEPARLNCSLAAVPGFTGSSDLAMAPLMVQPVPNPTDVNNVQQAAALARAFPDEVQKTAIVYSSLPSTIDATEKMLGTFGSQGFRFLGDCTQTYAIQGEADWKPIALRLKACGAEMVYFSGTPIPHFENLLDAAHQIGYDPIWFSETNFATPQLADWNVSGYADRLYVRMMVTPLEQADVNPATQQYVDIVTAAGGDVSLLGAQATSAFLLWATAAEECGSNLTSACVLDELHRVHDWTGGGLHPSTDPGANTVGECGMVLRLQGDEYVQWAPEERGTFECDPSFVVEVDPPLTSTASLKIDENRVSQKNRVGG